MVPGTSHISIAKPTEPQQGADGLFRVFLDSTLKRFANPVTFATDKLNTLEPSKFEDLIGTYRAGQARVIDLLSQKDPGKNLEDRQVDFLRAALSNAPMHEKCEAAVSIVLRMLNDTTFVRNVVELEEAKGPGGGSANGWLHKLEERVTFAFEVDNERIEEPTRWWMIYIGVRSAFQNPLVHNVIQGLRDEGLSDEEIIEKVTSSSSLLSTIGFVANNSYNSRVAFLNGLFFDAYSEWKEKGSYDHSKLEKDLHDGIEKRLSRLLKN